MGNRLNVGKNPDVANNYRLTASRGLFTAPGSPFGQLSFTAPSGELVHNQGFSITGTGFGTKSGILAPAVRDTQTAPANTIPLTPIGEGIYAAHPKSSAPADAPYMMQIQPTNYDPQGSGIGIPHPFVSGKWAGTSLDPSGTQPNEIFSQSLVWGFNLPSTIQSGDTCCVYLRWYERNDPAGSAAINAYYLSSSPTKGANAGNNKQLGYGPGGYGGDGAPVYAGTPAQSWISTITNFSGPRNNTDLGYILSLQDNTTPNSGITVIEIPDRNGKGSSHLWGVRANSYKATNGWVQMEIEMCIDTHTGSAGKGFLNCVVNGQRSLTNHFYPDETGTGNGNIIQYAGRTDNFMVITPTQRAISFGCGMYNGAEDDPTIVTYYSDIYCDISAGGVSGQVARVIIGDQPTYGACAICVPQVITSWSNTGISFTCWKDKFVTNQTGYIYVITEAGTVVPAGSAVWA